MTIEELKQKISFKLEENEHGLFRLTGQLRVMAQVSFGSLSDSNHETVLAWAKEDVSKVIIAHLYEDQRTALYESLDRLMTVNPIDFSRYQEAVEQVMKAANYQPLKHAYEQTPVSRR